MTDHQTRPEILPTISTGEWLRLNRNKGHGILRCSHLPSGDVLRKMSAYQELARRYLTRIIVDRQLGYDPHWAEKILTRRREELEDHLWHPLTGDRPFLAFMKRCHAQALSEIF